MVVYLGTVLSIVRFAVIAISFAAIDWIIHFFCTKCLAVFFTCYWCRWNHGDWTTII